MINTQILKQIENLEEEIQSIKWAIVSGVNIIPKAKLGKDIVQLTSGLLGKSFPKGTVYEKKMRRSLHKHMQRNGL